MSLRKRWKYFLIAVLSFALCAFNAEASPISRYYKPISVSTSLNWAGYAAQGGKFTDITATWIVPGPRGSKTLKTDAAWVGIGGVASPDLIQAGTESVAQKGRVNFRAWYELLPNYSLPIPVLVSAGDSVTVEISQLSKNKWQITFENNTSAKGFAKVVKYKSQLSSAEWIEEMPSNGNYDLIPLDNFKDVQFSNGYAVKDGQKVTIAESGATEIAMVSAKKKLLAMPTSLDGEGTGFEVKRK